MAYWAGFFDGEGCVTIKPNLQVRITQKGYLMANALKGEFGGGIYINTFGHYQWFLSGPRAARFLKDICEYSLLKKPQIKLALDFYENHVNTTRHGIGSGLSEEEKKIRKDFQSKIKELKKESYSSEVAL